MQENKIRIKTLKILAMDSDPYEHSINDINEIKKIIDILDVTDYDDLIYSIYTMVNWENRHVLENIVKAEGIAVELYEKINHLIVSNMHIVKECLNNRKHLLENDLRTKLLKIIEEKQITNFKDLIDYLEECKNKKYDSIIVVNEKNYEEEALPDTFVYRKAEYFLVRHYERLITYVVKETMFFTNYLILVKYFNHILLKLGLKAKRDLIFYFTLSVSNHVLLELGLKAMQDCEKLSKAMFQTLFC